MHRSNRKVTERMLQYKNYPIYGIAVPRPGRGWHCRGLVFEPEEKVKEIQRLECTKLIFTTKEKAEEYALGLCRAWIDASGSMVVD
jgi:hypothetical protein